MESTEKLANRLTALPNSLTPEVGNLYHVAEALWKDASPDYNQESGRSAHPGLATGTPDLERYTPMLVGGRLPRAHTRQFAAVIHYRGPEDKSETYFGPFEYPVPEFQFRRLTSWGLPLIPRNRTKPKLTPEEVEALALHLTTYPPTPRRRYDQ